MTIGCDIVKISRFKKNLMRLKTKILNEDEQIEFEVSNDKIKYLASRWACKEAIYKTDNTLYNVSILNDKNGKPYVVNHADLEISISHDANLCIAVAIKKN